MLFKVDPGNTGRVGPTEAALFLKKSGLPDVTLGKVTELVRPFRIVANPVQVTVLLPIVQGHLCLIGMQQKQIFVILFKKSVKVIG